jgi:hypothetical protein
MNCTAPAPPEGYNKLFIENLEYAIHKLGSQSEGPLPKVVFTYRKALKSLKEYPEPLFSGKQAQQIKGIGKFIGGLLDEFIQNPSAEAREHALALEQKKQKQRKF